MKTQAGDDDSSHMRRSSQTESHAPVKNAVKRAEAMKKKISHRLRKLASRESPEGEGWLCRARQAIWSLWMLALIWAAEATWKRWLLVFGLILLAVAAYIFNLSFAKMSSDSKMSRLGLM